jgi:hypothetical protein
MSELSIPSAAALLVIDVQKAIDDPKWSAWGPRNNPEGPRPTSSACSDVGGDRVGR